MNRIAGPLARNLNLPLMTVLLMDVAAVGPCDRPWARLLDASVVFK